MKTVSIGNLEPNLYITDHVFLDENYILLSPDTPVSQELTERLKRWRYSEVYTLGMPSSEPPAKSAISEAATGQVVNSGAGGTMDSDIKDKEAQKAAWKFFTETVEYLADTYKIFQERGDLSLNIATDKVKEIIEELKNNRNYILGIPDEPMEDTNYLVVNAAKTAILSLAIADFLKLLPYKQIEIGLAALFHEIGMLRIPKEMYMNNRKLNDKERKAIITHPILSYRILKELNFPQNVCVAVIEHHEYIDGSGYPRKLTGDSISLYGKIVGVASAYCAATSKRPFREGQDRHSGIMDLLKEMGKRYDDKIIRALVFTLSIYPIGTYVLMSNGAKALVVKTSTEKPKQPTIRLLINENNAIYQDPPMVQTQEGDSVTIQRPLNKSEVDELKKRFSGQKFSASP